VPTTSQLLAEYTLLLNRHGLDATEPEQFVRDHADNYHFVELAQTARRLKEALKTDNPEDA
jgi:hypothetical protein